MPERFQLPAQTLFLWRLRCAFLFGVPVAVLLLCMIRTVWTLIPAGILFILFLFCFKWYLPLYYRRYFVCLEESAVTVYSGVWFRSCRIMPYPRMIYATSVSTPLSRRLGLSALLLKAARGWIFIPELSAEDAELLLSAFSKERDTG